MYFVRFGSKADMGFEKVLGEPPIETFAVVRLTTFELLSGPTRKISKGTPAKPDPSRVPEPFPVISTVTVPELAEPTLNIETRTTPNRADKNFIICSPVHNSSLASTPSLKSTTLCPRRTPIFPICSRNGVNDGGRLWRAEWLLLHRPANVALGQKRTYAMRQPLSALPPIATLIA